MPQDELPIERLCRLLPGAKQRSTGWWVTSCPAHPDKHPSFGFREDEHQNVQLKCQANCTQEEILRALGLGKSDLYVRRNGSDLLTYDYTDAKGKLLYQVVRGANKKFWQRRPDGVGGWIRDMKGVTRVLYRLPEVLAAVKAGKPILVVEGEKDADNVRGRLELTATTNVGGAGKWQEQYTRALAGADVAILPDNDDPGQSHAELVRDSVLGTARSVRVVLLPGLPNKGDVSDWIAAGGGQKELLALCRETPPASRPSENPEFAGTYHLSDLGNAERMVAQHGCDLRYSGARRQWLLWDRYRWCADETGEVDRRAAATVRSMYGEAGAMSGEAKQALLKHALRSESNRSICAMITRAEALPGVAVRAPDLDRDPWIINCVSGVLDLRTGALRDHDRCLLLTKLAPTAHDEQAGCPTWLAFLDRIMEGNTDLISFLQRAIGYSLTGITTERVMFILHGSGKNGKSTLLETIRAMLGDYAARTPTETLMVKRDGSIPNDVARLQGARFVSASESDDGRRLAEAIIKDITGGDTITARFMRAEWFEFRPQFKLWLATNHRPLVKGTDPAIWDRLRLVPFQVRIPESEQDPTLLSKLLSELPGVFAWAVRGCLDWQRSGLAAPREVLAATSSYRQDMDVLAAFIEDCCVRGNEKFVSARALYAAYSKWCSDGGERPETQTRFGMRLSERGLNKARFNSGVRWYGLGLTSEYEQLTGSSVGSEQDEPDLPLTPYEGDHSPLTVKSVHDYTHPTLEDYEPGSEG